MQQPNIDSLDMDWMIGQAPWEIQQDRRAPKMCKVTVQFSPIHDITPGLDNRGSNRAPIFPVGRLAPGVAKTSQTV
jgi:hypothetical protein